VTLRGFCWR